MNFHVPISRVRPLRDALILLLWGGSILWLAARTQLSTYLHPALQPFTVASALVLLMLAAFTLRGMFVVTALQHECCSAHDACVRKQPRSLPLIFKTLILLIPLCFAALGESNHFTMTTVHNRGVIQSIANLPSAKSSASSTAESPTPGGAPISIQIIDLLYAVQMPSYREEFVGKEVEMRGQFVPLTTGNRMGDRFQAIRLFITCCAADAKPVGVTVQYPKVLKIPEMAWIKITGKATFPLEGGRRTALLEASKVELCEAPEEPFVY